MFSSFVKTKGYDNYNSGSLSRRGALDFSFATMSLLFIPQSAIATMMTVPEESEKRLFVLGESLGKEKAIERFKMARDDLTGLLKNYDEISAEGGDNIRRYLGK